MTRGHKTIGKSHTTFFSIIHNHYIEYIKDIQCVFTNIIVMKFQLELIIINGTINEKKNKKSG